MRIVLIIEKRYLQNRSDWRFFVAYHLSQKIDAVKVVLLDKESTYKADTAEGIWERKHYQLESKNSRVNQSCDYTNFTKDICIEKPECDDMVVNLSSCSVLELFKSFDIQYVWEIQYHKKGIQYYTHIGESELTHNQECIEISLVAYDLKYNRYVKDVARYNPHYSAVRNYQNVVYTLHLLLLKYYKKPFGGCNEKNTSPAHYSFSNYAFCFYRHAFKLHYYSILTKYIPSIYPERWTVGISRGSFLKNGINEMVVNPNPHNEFWADPFIYKHPASGNYYIFIERFPFREKKGVISVGEVDENLHIKNMHEILVAPYHLSYPHLIQENDDLYMMPECSANKRLEIYRCDEFPNKWNLFSYGLEGESVTDTVYYKDVNGDRWLFTTISDSDIIMHSTILNIYKIDSLQLNTIIPHQMNPIIIDSSIARNGGRIYVEDGHVYRVAQNNTYGEYGHGVTIREIKKLTLDDYEEVEVKRLDGRDILDFKYTHQMCQIENMFVMDLRK